MPKGTQLGVNSQPGSAELGVVEPANEVALPGMGFAQVSDMPAELRIAIVPFADLA